MKLLAIESSCDETAAAVVENGRTVLSSVVASQIEEHKLYGGVVPEIASRRHSEAIVGVTKQALEQAHVTLKERHCRYLRSRINWSTVGRRKFCKRIGAFHRITVNPCTSSAFPYCVQLYHLS